MKTYPTLDQQQPRWSLITYRLDWESQRPSRTANRRKFAPESPIDGGWRRKIGWKTLGKERDLCGEWDFFATGPFGPKKGMTQWQLWKGKKPLIVHFLAEKIPLNFKVENWRKIFSSSKKEFLPFFSLPKFKLRFRNLIEGLHFRFISQLAGRW